MCPVVEGLKVCPELIIVDASDLAPFRKASDEVNEFWYMKMGKEAGKNIEKKGFDESFLNVTSHVEDRIKQGNYEKDIHGKPKLVGKIIDEFDPKIKEEYRFLAVASQIASEWRQALRNDIGYTCCGGIASGKVGAKFAVNYNKPNGQAIMFPAALKPFLLTKPIRSIQGVGRAMNKEVFHAIQAKSFMDSRDFDKDYHDITCEDVISAGKDILFKHLKNPTSVNFLWAVVNGIDEAPLIPSSFYHKNLSCENTDIPHPTNLDKTQMRLPIICNALIKLLRERHVKASTLPDKIKVTLCHRGPKAKNWDDWVVKSKQCRLNYTNAPGWLKGELDLSFLASSASELTQSLFKEWFFDIGKREQLKIVRINVSTTDFVAVSKLKKLFKNKDIKSFFIGDGMKSSKIEVDAKNQTEEIIEVIDQSSDDEIIDLTCSKRQKT